MSGIVQAWGSRAVACLLATGLAVSAATQEKPPEVSKELVKEAKKALRGKKKDLPGSLGIVHELVRRQHTAGEHKKSIPLLKKVIRIDPWDMRAQIYYAEALHALGKAKEARKKAHWILDHARQDRARNGAAKIADEPGLPKLEDLETSKPGSPRVVLILVPPVDDAVVYAVADRLQDRLSIPVVVRRAKFVTPPKPSRGEMEDAIRPYRVRFEESATDEEVQEILKRHGLMMDQLLKTYIFAPVYRPWLIRTERWKDLREWDRDVTAKRRLQWEGNDLFRWMRRAVGRSFRVKDYYLGITSVDMHLGPNMGFNFAVSGGPYSIIAYSRFLPWATSEDPDFERLVTRVHKQTLCSIGRCFGILRCQQPACASSYANGLRDHDEKRESYCPNCLDKIKIAKRP